jgi:hypothetical protein
MSVGGEGDAEECRMKGFRTGRVAGLMVWRVGYR